MKARLLIAGACFIAVLAFATLFLETRTRQTPKAEIKTPEVQPLSADGMPWGDLYTKLHNGDPSGDEGLISIENDPSMSLSKRLTALRMLTKSTRKDTLMFVYDQLSSSNVQIRAAAYYGMPDKLRPHGYDYTSAPNAISKAKLSAQKGQIFR